VGETGKVSVANCEKTVSSAFLLPCFDQPPRSTDNLWMSPLSDWLPEMARSEPARSISVAYQVPAEAIPIDFDRTVVEALHASSLAAIRIGASSWRVLLPWQTRVFALIPREVDEDVQIHLFRRPDLCEIVVSCKPSDTHSAHASGLAAVLFIAASVWIASGPVAGLAASITTVLAGALVVEVTRQWAFDALEKRIRSLAGDVGSALTRHSAPAP